MSTTPYTNLRPLTPLEADSVTRLRVLASGCPLVMQSIIAELVVSREVIRTVRRVRRCLPREANAALDGLPHRRATAVEYAHD